MIFLSRQYRSFSAGERVSISVAEWGLLFRSTRVCKQAAVPMALQTTVLHPDNWAKASGSLSGGRRLNNFLKRSYYCLLMHLYYYSTARSCDTCARNRVLSFHKKLTKLFPSTTLEFVAIDFPIELVETARKHNYILVILETFSKLVRRDLLKAATAENLAKEFGTYLETVNVPLRFLFVRQRYADYTAVFSTCVQNLEDQKLVHYNISPTSHRRMQQYNCRTVFGILLYVEEPFKQLDLHTDILTSRYNTQIHPITSCTPLS